jgi:hypothetical protein
MNQNNELFKLCSKSIKIKKYLGLFVHRSVDSDDSIKRFKNKISFTEGKNQTDLNNDDDDDDFSHFFEKKNLIKKTNFSKFHFVYCMILTAVKVICWLFIIYYSFSNKAFTSLFQTSSLFTNSLIQAAGIIGFILLCIHPIYFLIINYTHSGFHKSVLSFEYFERQITNFLDYYRVKITDHGGETSSMKVKLKRFSFFYILSCCFLTAIISYTSSALTEIILNTDSFQLIRLILMGILMIISFLDFYFGIYFITKNLIIIQHQIDTFYNILKILIENKQSKIRIESVRRLYSCLFNHVKTADNWIGYYYGIYYTTVIPIFIIYLYASVFGGLQIEMIKNNSAILILYAYFLVLLTTIAVRLNSKV